MIVLVFLILFTALAFYYGNFIRKHSLKFYIGTSIFSIVAFLLNDKPFMKPITQGFLGLSLFYLVMIAGSVPKKSKLRIKLFGLRREYSIIGFIISMPHALKYLLQVFNGTITIPWFGLIAFIMMIPLFITSFATIRKKISLKTWKLIQSPAYLIYLLLLIHLIKNYSEKINLILYIVMFSFYFISKVIYEWMRIKEKKRKLKIT